ncbi:hypothetical protein F5050DRAFT_1802198 [Lentinula boryana]|uniref:DUF6589 domain-containing protein n=1 Tax=Lentinula boryana TaxID=40481 RepID=A0ABQ8Q0M0_9AGAR|nr:hypothetical protein F5050DRAFT_1802198 [Lentinula boryana]
MSDSDSEHSDIHVDVPKSTQSTVDAHHTPHPVMYPGPTPGYHWYPYASPSTPIIGTPNQPPSTPIISAPAQPPLIPIIGAHVQPPSTPIQPSSKPASQPNRVTSIGFGPNSTEPTDPTTRKLERILSAIQDEDWSFGKFLYHFFRTKDEDGVEIKGRTKRHAGMMSIFMHGNSNHDEYGDMFSVTKSFENIHHARPALTSFAAQLVKDHLLLTAKSIVSPNGGLHREQADQNEKVPILEGDVEAVLESEKSTLEKTQSKPPEDGHALTRNHRQPEIVTTYALSSLLFSRNRNANLLPTKKAMLLFACQTNLYLFAHESRVGASTNYTTVLRMLDKHAKANAAAVEEIAHSKTRAGILRFDNMQKQINVCHQRLGHTSQMLIGCAGTYCEGEELEEGALDLDDKKRCLKQNLRASLSFDQLWSLIDHDFFTKVLPLQWLGTLFGFLDDLPEIHQYGNQLQQLYEKIGTKQKVSPCTTKVYPLKSNAYNETVTAELLKAIQDFLAQLGMSSDHFVRRLILAGGDGLSYERMVQLKNYLQFLENDFDRLDLLEPFLETWHTIWTNLSRIYEAHWVGLTSADPSTLGFGGNTLKRKEPGNVSKVDYYHYIDLLECQVEAWMLDIWRNELGYEDLHQHMEGLSKSKQLPTFEELYQRAIDLHQRFGSKGEGYKTGSQWKPPKTDASSANLGVPISSRKKQKQVVSPVLDGSFDGDETFARSTRLIYDGAISQLATSAIRRGDVGCVWECLKMMTFSFAGSSHTKYTGYLLEMICNFELESTPKLKNFFLNNWLISSNGHTYEAGDLFQEQLQDELYEHINHDQSFDNLHVRERLAPNVYCFKQTKKAHHAYLGLASRSGSHASPSRTADIRKLMAHYQQEELHLFRQGRQYGEVEQDQDGRLAKWIHETCRAMEHTELQIHTFDKPVEGVDDNALYCDEIAFNLDSSESYTGQREDEEHLEDEVEPLQCEDEEDIGLILEDVD